MTGGADRAQPRPPRVPGFVLSALPHSHRNHILGDLTEEYLRLARRRAPQLATLWFWKELATSIMANIFTRLR